MDRQAFALQKGCDLSRPFHPGLRQPVGIEQDRRPLPEQVGLGPAARSRIEGGRHQAATWVARRGPPGVETLRDAPFGQAMAVERALGQFGLFVRVLEPGQESGLA
jgi:hypothetical protein